MVGKLELIRWWIDNCQSAKSLCSFFHKHQGMLSLDNWKCFFLFFRSNKLVAVGKKEIRNCWRIDDEMGKSQISFMMLFRVWIIESVVFCFIRSNVIVRPRSWSQPGLWAGLLARAESVECVTGPEPGPGREREWLQSTSLDSVPGHSSPSLSAPEQQKQKLHRLFIKQEWMKLKCC